jgi:diacylglycerol kinase (ATP)
MRAAVIFGWGTSTAQLKPFQANSPTEWLQGLPASSTDAEAVVIFGGDGTIHRHLPALVRLGLPVLVVPAGSGNDFARALNLRSVGDSVRVWREFEAGKIQARAIDLGVIVAAAAPEQVQYFCSVAGCGLDSAATRRANRMPRWLRGHGGYALSILPLLLDLPVFSLRLSASVAGQESTEAGRPTLLAAFANTPYYGDGMRIAPQADCADGQIDICRIGQVGPVKLLAMFPTVYFGRHLSLPEVEYSRAERVQLQTGTPQEIYADGEFVCETPATVSIAAGALKVIYPAR